MTEDLADTRLGAFCLLVAPYIGQSTTSRREFLHLLDRRYRLSQDQRAWCDDMLESSGLDRRDVAMIGRVVDGVVAGEEWQLLWDFVDWILPDLNAKAQLLEEFVDVGCLPEVGRKIFSEDTVRAFTIIGISPTFDNAAVESAFRRTMRLIHPDVTITVGLEPFELRRAEDLAKRVSAARDRIHSFYRALGSTQSVDR